MREVVAWIVAAALLLMAASLATTLHYYRRRRQRASDSERALGRRIVAELPAADDLVFFSEDDVRFHYGEQSIDKDLSLAARVLINGEHSQANFWFVGGAGNLRGNDFGGGKTMLAPGISADYETTRFYVSGSVRLYRAPGINHDFASVRTGFSFYEVDYDETQPWLIVEARRMRGLSEGTEITPMLRLIHNRYFVEFGINNMKQGRFNFMYIF